MPDPFSFKNKEKMVLPITVAAFDTQDTQSLERFPKMPIRVPCRTSLVIRKSPQHNWKANLFLGAPLPLDSLSAPITSSCARLPHWIGNKKTAPPLSRQPGYLIKTRGFPTPPCDGCGLLLGFQTRQALKLLSRNIYDPIHSFGTGFRSETIFR